MRHEFRLADIGEGLEEAEIISWLVAVGDTVARDQPLIEVMTDKSNAELPAPAHGTVVSLEGNVGDIINVGELIAVIESADADSVETVDSSSNPGAASPAVPEIPRVIEAASPFAAGTEAAVSSAPSAAAAVAPVQSPPAADPAAPRVKASPSTRRAAAERDIDLTAVTGSGPGGRVLLSDLDAPALPAAAAVSAPAAVPPPVLVSAQPTVATQAAMQAVEAEQPTRPDKSAAPTPVGTIPLRGIRRAVAQNMTKSWSEIPHIHAFEHIDAEPLLKVRSRLRDTERPAYQSLTPLAFFVAAVARALGGHPEANASINMAEETISYHPAVNVGVAVASENGLVVPVLQAADQLDFETLSLTLTQLVRGAREAQLSREHYIGGTVTITNFGALGGEQAAPLIRPPEALILGFGSIANRPFVIDGQVVARKTMHIVAGADHRLLDGDVVTSVLSAIAESLSDPLGLVI